MLTGTAVLAACLAMAPPSTRSAPVRRGNTALARRHGPVFSVIGAPRLGVLLAGGADVIQPVGFGAGLSFRVHALHLGPIRLGGAVDLGHTRFLERRTVDGFVDGQAESAERYAALGHTDLGAGPSLQVVLGPIYVEANFTVGAGISTFSRPLGVLTTDEEHHSDVSAMLRAGGLVGIPIRNNQGLTIGTSVQRYFSSYQLIGQPVPPEDGLLEQEPDTNPFDLLLDVSLGYLFMF